MIKNILEIELFETYENVEFEIRTPMTSLEFEWTSTFPFNMIYIYDPQNRLIGQIVSPLNKGKRIVSLREENTSPCFKYIAEQREYVGTWRIECSFMGASSDTGHKMSCKLHVIENEYAYDKALESGETEVVRLVKNTLESEEKWYRGDFHTHTVFSDGKMTREENTDFARMNNMDFFVATDHNIVHYNWPKSDNFPIFSGIELTSPLGHVNLHFLDTSPFENRSIRNLATETGFLQLLEEKKASLVAINHPFMEPWAFEADSFLLEDFDLLEIINDPTYINSITSYERALYAWTLLLNDGYKIPAIGGSDSHNLPSEPYEYSEYPSILGDPSTWVFCHGLHEETLKTALKEGRIVVSREVFIDLKSGKHIPGDNILTDGTHGTELRVKLSSKTFQNRSLKILWVMDGIILKETVGDEDEIFIDVNENYHWLRVDVRTEDGLLVGFTNPIFFNEHKKTAPHTMKTWGDLRKRVNSVLAYD